MIFLTRFGSAQENLKEALNYFGSSDVVDWVESFGLKTFIGTSGRVFPKNNESITITACMALKNCTHTMSRLTHATYGQDGLSKVPYRSKHLTGQ